MTGSATSWRRLCALVCTFVLFLLAGCAPVASEEPGQTKPPAAAFEAKPSGAAFMEMVSGSRGELDVTDEMRLRFNLFARDYRFIYLPDMHWYESFFETTHYGDSFGYANFADAVFYVLQYMGCPDAVSDRDMEQAVTSLFAAREDYLKMPHQPYRKFAEHTDGYYSPWPEGGRDHNRMFYLLDSAEVSEGEDHAVLVTLRSKEYYFEDAGAFEAGPAERWLAARAGSMGVPGLEAAATLTSTGEIGELEPRRSRLTVIRIDPAATREIGFQIVSNRDL